MPEQNHCDCVSLAGQCWCVQYTAVRRGGERESLWKAAKNQTFPAGSNHVSGEDREKEGRGERGGEGELYCSHHPSKAQSPAISETD